MSNLPPGVNEGMIPGNRPEDIAYDEWWGKFDNKCEEKNIVVPNEVYDSEWFTEAIDLAKDMGYDEGFIEGEMNERYKSDEAESSD